MDKLCNLFRELGNSLDLDETLATLDCELARIFPFRTIAVYLAENGRLLPAYASGDGFQNVASRELRWGEELAGRAAATAKPVCGDLALAYPIEAAGEVRAVLSLYRAPPGQFSADDLRALDSASSKIAAAIANALRCRRAEQQAGLDPVSGLPGARVLFQRLDAELARTRRAGLGLALLACAVEGLPGPTDPGFAGVTRRGLERIGADLRASCREYDFAGRSGDEFVLVLPGFCGSGVEEKRARIAQVVEEAGLAVGLPLCAHVGAALFPEDGGDAEDLMAAAARNLFLARQASRHA